MKKLKDLIHVNKDDLQNGFVLLDSNHLKHSINTILNSEEFYQVNKLTLLDIPILEDSNGNNIELESHLISDTTFFKGSVYLYSLMFMENGDIIARGIFGYDGDIVTDQNLLINYVVFCYDNKTTDDGIKIDLKKHYIPKKYKNIFIERFSARIPNYSEVQEFLDGLNK